MNDQKKDWGSRGRWLVTAGLAIALSGGMPATAQVVINEVDYDQPGTDAAEYVELFGAGGLDLAGWNLELHNGSNGEVYTTVALTALPADGYLVVGSALVPNVDIIAWETNGVQNSAPDGIVICDSTGAVVDAISYEGSLTAVGGCADGQTLEDIGVSDNNTDPSLSLSRCPDGTGAFAATPVITPGTMNDCDLPPAGACCLAGQCEDGFAQDACEVRGGIYQGDGTDCSSVECPAAPPVMISEIMYNPASNEGGPPDFCNRVEWVEIYNYGPVAIDLTGWQLADEDPDGIQWLAAGPIPAASIDPGEAVVLIPGPDSDESCSGATIADFQAAWGEGFQVIPLTDWNDHLFGLSSGPGADNEILTLWDAAGIAVDVANFDDEDPWPVDPGGPSIYVLCTALDNVQNDDGANWANSVSGTDGAYDVTPTLIFDGADVGSPGVVATCGEDCPGDIDGDNMVGFSDLLEVLSLWGPCLGCPADIDGDNLVGFSDLLFVLSTWGPCP